MGLDNGFVTNVSVDKMPKNICFPYSYPDTGEEVDLCYFRKYWGFRNDVIAMLGRDLNDTGFEIPISREQLNRIIRILDKYLDREYWDEYANSIWTYDEAKENLFQSFVNLSWFKFYSKEHPEAKLYFYDSY